MLKFSWLKVASLALAGIGLLVSSELQKQEIQEAVDKNLAKRRLELDTPPTE